MQPGKIIVGAMRFADEAAAVAAVRRAIDYGFNYVDTSPCYCYTSDEVNSERWVGKAIDHPDYRARVMISAKCATGNGGFGLGEFEGRKGFGVRTAAQFTEVFDQSRRRLGVERFDYYHLWTTHTKEQFDEAFKKGGWYDGLLSRRDQWGTLGITTHADNDTIIRFLESGKFKTVTLPLNVINRVRMRTVEYCRENGIAVIAMNPLAGGFLAADNRLKELALRYLMRLDNVHVLVGFQTVEHVEYAGWIRDTMPRYGKSAGEILAEVDSLIDAQEPRCTACGYCLPCPQDITVGACLSYYNIYHYMGLESAKKAFRDKQWEDGLRLDRCVACGQCESRCPNGLPVVSIIEKAKEALYG
ncbi:MAG: hypothetical protein GF418_08125 [Chitinivibrionales bacterium]|nr:hypothetical protein [Chitinivibrionales bacterium]MBD3395580.1 hypothetical protein [Chitinivibrionales bacterium]